MVRYKRCAIIIAVLFSLVFDTRAGSAFTLRDCEEAAENGIFLAQSELATLYFNGSSPVLGSHPQNYSKAKYYSFLAVSNKKSTGEETARLKSKHMAQLALINIQECNEDSTSTSENEAFFWSYASIANGVDKSNCSFYNRIVEAAALGMRKFAAVDDRFMGEYLYLVNESESDLRDKSDYKRAVERGYKAANGLKLRQRRNLDGTYMFIGEISKGKANGTGIQIGQRALYFGGFKNGEYDGQGCLRFAESGNMMIGEWQNHKLQNGVSYKKNQYYEPSVIYRNGKDIFPRPISLKVGNPDEKGDIIHRPVDMNLSVRWAEGVMGCNENLPVGKVYRWGATNHKHIYQSHSQSAPGYLPRMACLAIYGGANRNSDIISTGYDAPYSTWSNSWRLPTKAEMNELITACNVAVELDGTLVISNPDYDIDGGIRITIPKSKDGYGLWTGSINMSDNNEAYALILDMQSREVRIESRDRECAFAILPVTDIQYLKKEKYVLP